MRQDTFQQDTLRPDDAAGDPVDVIVGQWERERPDLSVRGKEITGRIIRLGNMFRAAYTAAFEALGLNEGDYGVLAPLRRAGAPYVLTPTELAKQRMMTSGGITAAVDRLESKGLVERVPNPADRRGNLVQLTSEGLEVIDEAMTRHVAIENELVAALDDAQHAQLVDLLRKLM